MRIEKVAIATVVLLLGLPVETWARGAVQLQPSEANPLSSWTTLMGRVGTVETIPSRLPDQIPLPAGENQTTASTQAGHTNPSTGRRFSRKKGAAGPVRHAKPRRRVIKNGGADDAEVQLSEGMPDAVAAHRRASTATLLTATEANLKRISKRSLTMNQQATVNQIRLFMQQSRDAIQQSDVDRAHTLALKAHLLSDSLMRP